MKKLTTIIVLAFGLCLTANADIWMWVDALGKTHFVDTITPIYTWVDEFGKVHYSDKPEHASAVSVQLVWHSIGVLADTGDLADTEGDNGSAVASRGREIDPNETIDERIEREIAEAYYCKRATEIYNSYLNAPKLYKTTADGEKLYLTDEEAEATLSETKTKVAEFCN